jgi:hypothetical protein
LYNCIEDSGKNYFIDNIDTLLIPISNLQQREQIYVKKREMFINFLEYKYLEKQNTTTDFIVNNKKIQEKVAARRKDREKDNLLVHLSSNNGKMHNRARHFRAYRLGENEYYWINSSIDNRFWIIPEDILYEKGYISKPDETINKKVLSISISTDWVKEYQYDYDNINRERIENIFK